MSPEILLNCKDNGVVDVLQHGLSEVYNKVARGEITPEQANIICAELTADLDFVYKTLGVVAVKPYRQAA